MRKTSIGRAQPYARRSLCARRVVPEAKPRQSDIRSSTEADGKSNSRSENKKAQSRENSFKNLLFTDVFDR